MRPSLQIIDFAGAGKTVDIRLVEKGGPRDQLPANLAKFMTLLSNLGTRYRAKGGKRWQPCQFTRWSGFVVDARAMEGLTLHSAK